MSYVDQQYQQQPPQRGGQGGQQQRGKQQQQYGGKQSGGLPIGGQQQQQGGGGVVSKAPVMRISGAPQFIVPPTPKPEPENKKQWNIEKLRETDGIVPPQYGSNQFASQKGMIGFGTARDVGGKHLHRFWEAMGDECVGLDRTEFEFGGNVSGAQKQKMQQGGRQQQQQQQQQQQYQPQQQQQYEYQQ